MAPKHPEALMIFPNNNYPVPNPDPTKIDAHGNQYGDPYYVAHDPDNNIVYWPLNDPHNTHIAIPGTQIGDCAINQITNRPLGGLATFHPADTIKYSPNYC